MKTVRIVEFPIGVDTLGFPVYHQHIFFSENKTTANLKKQKLINGVIQKQVKQH